MGVGLPDARLPMALGWDAAGVTPDGQEVILHGLIGDPDWRGDETLDPKRTLLSELHQGTFAEKVMVPRRNLIPKPDELSWAQAACLPTAWLTAYRMLFVRSGLQPVRRCSSRAPRAVWRPGRSAGPRRRTARLGDRPR
jgi:NADPH:quinone reductase-like Zn-dependent oxidoreductase